MNAEFYAKVIVLAVIVGAFIYLAFPGKDPEQPA